MNSKKIFVFLSICFIASLLGACGQNENDAINRLQVNKKYVLTSWPDSAYIAELDSILKAEPLKPSADSEKTKLTIYSGAIPTIRLPGQKTAKEEKIKDAASEKRSATVGSSSTNSAKNAERFADNFMTALSHLQSDPSSTSKYTIVSVQNGENLFALLSRIYGEDATKLPRFYTLSALQSVNPGVKLEHLNAGDKVRVPKIKD